MLTPARRGELKAEGVRGRGTPCLVVDLTVVRERYAGLRAAFGDAAVHYAVKANPEPAVLRTLVALGSSFDVASPGEVAACLTAGAAPATLSYGNPVRKPTDVAAGHAAGVRTFVTDSVADLRVLAAVAPGARVWCRIAVGEAGSATPFGGKFGCSVEEAAAILDEAEVLGLRADGVAFHVGSQQRDPAAFTAAIAAAARLGPLRVGPLRTLNVGGGFPARYADAADGEPPPLANYATAIGSALAEHFPGRPPRLVLEPGRVLVADAGVLHAEVVLVTRRAGRRWVYLDVGRYSGLAETEGEAIVYRVRAPDRSGPAGPVVLAGPSCDGDDVLYRHIPVELPLGLRAGDRVEISPAGAYTASYAAVGWNGFPPLPVHCVGATE